MKFRNSHESKPKKKEGDYSRLGIDKEQTLLEDYDE